MVLVRGNKADLTAAGDRRGGPGRRTGITICVVMPSWAGMVVHAIRFSFCVGCGLEPGDFSHWQLFSPDCGSKLNF